MKAFSHLWVLLACCLMAGWGAGCSTGSNSASVVKTRGVYTTLAITNDSSLYLPGGAYQKVDQFKLGEQPAAVVVGYGLYDGSRMEGQPFNLQLTELPSGRVLDTLSGMAYYDKAATFPLRVRTSGDYQLRLMINDSVYDTWNFTIQRAADPDVAAAAPAYARGALSARLASDPGTAMLMKFMKYDDLLLQSIMDQVERKRQAADPSLWVQVLPGKTIVQFQLDSQGNIHEPKVLASTLNWNIANFLAEALTSGAPYLAWPAELRSHPPRVMTCTFYLD